MKPKILIIDDDSNIRLLYQKKLLLEGFCIDTASSADIALSKLKASKFDLIILDIEMPDISGLELIHNLKKSAPGIGIIINSAYSTYKSDFNSWLADDYIVKSSDLQPLINNIKKILGTLNECK